jgi:hypothetical protein
MGIFKYLWRICIVLILGLGLQWFIWGILTFTTIDPSKYEWHQWGLQGLYILFLITYAIDHTPKCKTE